ncbi:MAG: SDR family oxidoreductase, partial [Bacillota bacterium]|nr:SDR family oxidoreductase [Bacillota bacterium]
RGIGRSIAQSIAKEGASVIINYSKDMENSLITERKIIEGGGYCKSIKADVSHYSEAKSLISSIINKFGRIDILVNNAGVSKVGLFIDTTEEDFDNILNTNLKGMYNICHNALKYMIERKSGSIINISSIWGETGASCEVLYSASKGGVNSFTKSLAKEIAGMGIRVNAIAPGVINTNMNSFLNEDEKQVLIEEIPMGRFGETSDVSDLAVFLASEKSKYITGQIIKVDGGFI